MDVKRIGSGGVQMRHDLPDLTEPSTAELSFTLRNQSGAPVQFAVRHRGVPYKFIWRSPPLADAEWVTRTLRFPLPAAEQSVRLYIMTRGVGPVDIAHVALRAFDRDEYVKQLKEAHPDGGPANLMRQTRFPAGLLTGWSLDRDSCDEDHVAISSDESGSLAIQASQAASVTSAPFRTVNPAVEHRAVALVTGSGSWRIEVFGQGSRPIASTPITLRGTEAFEAAVDFQPDLFSSQGQLRFRSEGEGVLNVAWVKVGPAASVDSFDASSGPAVDLRLTGSDAAAAGVQFDDEQAVIEVRALDAPMNARLRIDLIHGKGGTESFTLPAHRVTKFTELNVSDRPLGAYRVEAWLEVAGQAVTPVSERVVYKLRRPKHWGVDAPDSFLGVHTEATHRHGVMAKALGINWVRLHDPGLDLVGWHFVEPEPGQWAFDDAGIERYRDEHLMIFGQLGTSPYWASYYPPDRADSRFSYWNKYFQPRDLADYSNYVRTATERYRDRIRAWDVWNEPWIHAWWAVDFDPSIGGRAGFLTSEHAQQDYVALKTSAYETAKSVDPSLIVAGFNTSTNDNPGSTRFTGPDWTRGVYEAGGLEVSDVLTYHHYAGGSLGHPGDDVELGLEKALGEVFAHETRGVRPIWMTEGQPNIGRAAAGMYRHTLTETNTDTFIDAGDRMVRYLTSLRANGVERVFLYSMHGFTGIFDGGGRWRTLTQADGTLHPVGAALSTFAYHIDGLPFRQRIEPASGVHVYVFGGNSRHAAVVLTQAGHDPWSIPDGSEDLWGNPLPVGTPIDQTAVYLTGTSLDRLIEPR
ncbi:MAG: hypothetical protein AAF823_02535 [Planctomycetota bacterium]